jgi:hypothetical protein
MEQKNLIRGHRYLFHYKKEREGRTTFRANFLGMNHYNNHIGNYYPVIVLNKYFHTEWSASQQEIWYMDFNLIKKIESLSFILDGKTKLPDDVLHIIDGYL